MGTNQQFVGRRIKFQYEAETCCANNVTPKYTTIKLQPNKRVREKKEGDVVENQQSPKLKKGVQAVLESETKSSEDRSKVRELARVAKA